MRRQSTDKFFGVASLPHGITVEIEAILDEQVMPLSKIMNLQVGETVLLNSTPDSKIEMRCRGVPLLRGRMGRAGSSVAVRVEEAIERTDASRAL